MGHSGDGPQGFYLHFHIWIIFWTLPVTSQ